MSERMILGRKVEKVQFSSPGGVLKGKVEVQDQVFWDFTIETESPQRPGNLPKISGYLYTLMRDGSSTPRLSCIGEVGRKELNEILAVALPGLAIGMELEKGDYSSGRPSVYLLVTVPVDHSPSHSDYGKSYQEEKPK